MLVSFLNSEIVIAEAASWEGTPYRHQAALKHVGCDCYGLIRGVYGELTGFKPDNPANYSFNWMRDSALKNILPEVSKVFAWPVPDSTRPGDVLIFAIKDYPVHTGILLDRHHFIHCLADRGIAKTAICRYDDKWRDRRVGTYRYIERG